MATETFVHANLVAGDFPILAVSETLLSGQNILKGTVLGKITTGGKLKIVNSANADGSQVAYAIAPEDVDATAGDKVMTAWITGEYNGAKLIFGGSDVIATHKLAMQAKMLIIRTATPA